MTKPKTILVTGASGYIAKHIVLQLLAEGYHVRASLRSIKRAGEVRDAVRQHLAKGVNLDKQLDFVELDLEKDAGWDSALKGVDALLHTASPFPMIQPSDPQDLVRPAVEGTLRALRAAKAAGVGRVVLTSSGAAVTNREPPADRPFDERDWSQPGYKTLTPYSRSKLEAELAAWAFVKDEAPAMRLTVINPNLVVGKPLDAYYGTSLAVIERLMRGKDPMLPDIGFNCVDVADIAKMHVLALSKPKSEGLRLIGSNGFFSFRDIALLLAKQFPHRRIPTRVAPHFLIRLLGMFDKAIASIIPSLGRKESISGALAGRVLGMTFRDPAQSISEAAQFMADNAIVQDAGKPLVVSRPRR